MRQCIRFAVVTFAVAWLFLGVGFASGAEKPAENQDDEIYPGDTVVVVKDGVELGVRDKAAAVLNVGAKIQVTEIRDNWIGGVATVDGKRHTGWVNRNEVKLDVQPAEEVNRIVVPDEPDAKAAVDALQAKKVTFELNEKKNVHAAKAAESEITDEGLAQFQGLHQLATLELSGRPITDAGLKQLGALPTLQNLYLENTKVTDAGLACVKTLVNVEALALTDTPVNGSGLAQLVALKNLRILNLGKCPITDEAMQHIGKFANLEVLAIPGSKVTSAGLAHLKNLPKLRVLNLIDCKVDDEGLKHLDGLTELRMLYVKGTGVTPEGSRKLKDAMPSLAIFRN
jgi:hypothetical protein